MSRSIAVVVVLVVLASLTTGMVGATDIAEFGGYEGSVSPTTGGDATLGGASVGDAPIDSAADPEPAAVRVGVIGSGFDSGHPALSGRVSAHGRIAGPSLAFDGPASTSHDTAVAEIVADRTEGAGLYLVGVGSQPTPGEYARAVDWLLANDVDVIVDSGSYFPATAGGKERIAGAAERAADDGTVFVTSAGNYAKRHWRGTPEAEGWIEFDGDVQGNRLGEGSVSGEVTLRLYWDGSADYDLYLYRDLPGRDDPVVAKSTRESGNAEAIDETLPTGNYYVAIYAREPGDEPVDLFATERSLAVAGAAGSTVAPANTEGVITVGAVDDSGTVASYSSGGADVSAPGSADTHVAGRFSGTSAAAPMVAGAVASMRDDGSLTPAQVEAILRRTAEGDERTVDIRAALEAAANASAPNGTAAADASRPPRSGANTSAPEPYPGP
ncbi:S8 family serine peptidase [Halorarum halobium]|uniref:S8 family serine peptidase n=1 Tax=Halorarum halobium TaxID=3075121 RepID=UPI0028AA1648|nr:S8 family serine peptidase [Halobaculum sp. XH14]